MSSLLTATQLAALMSARLCHDLIGPIGAITSAVSVLDDPDAADMREDATNLVRESSEKARARLEFCRLAFGAGGSAPGLVEMSALQRLAGDMYQGSKASLIWKNDSGGLPKPAARALLNMIMLGMDAAARGGEVRIEAAESGGESRLRVAAKGPKAKLYPTTFEALDGKEPEGGFDGRTIQPYYLFLIIQELGGRVDARAEENWVELNALAPSPA